jgi:hypothetical protein
MEDRPEIWPRPELLHPSDLEVADNFVARLAAYDSVRPGALARAVASVVAHLMVATLETGTDATPEASACHVLAIADLMITKWEQHRDQTMN